MISEDDEKTRKELGEKLKKLREDAKLTQAELATKAGVHANFYAMVERGEATISFDRLKRVMKALGVKSLDISDAE